MKHDRNTPRAIKRVLFASGLSLAATSMAADDIYWVGYQADCVPFGSVFDASFHHGDNWLGFVTPTSADTVIFGSGVNPGGRFIQPNVYFGDFCFDVFPCPSGFIVPAATALSARLLVQDGRYVFDLGPGFIPGGSCSLEAQDTGRYQIVGEDEPFYIGSVVESTGLPGDAHLEVRNGIIEARFVRIAARAGTTGTLVVSGSGAEARFGRFPDIGYLGEGSVVVENAGLLASEEWITIGVLDGGVGLVRVEGSGSQVTARDWIDVGYVEGSRGSLRVSDGASVTARMPIAGAFVGSQGTIEVSGDGGLLVGRESIRIGQEGQGSLLIEQGAQASVRPAVGATGQFVVGMRPGSSGEVDVTGVGSSLLVTGNFLAGDGGRADVRVGGGASILVEHLDGADSGILIVGQLTESESVVTIDGSGTTWTCGAQVQVGRSGIAELRVQGGAMLSSASAGSPTNSSGIIGTNADGAGTVILAGAETSWRQDAAMSVGFGGRGVLEVTGGAKLQSALGYVARFGASEGAVEIRGVGSAWSIGEGFYLGGNEAGPSMGQATLHVRDGGRLTAGDVTLHHNGQLRVSVAPGAPVMVRSAGGADLGGRLEVLLADGYQPMPGDTHRIIDASLAVGRFEEVVLPDLPSDIEPRLVYDSDGVAIAFGCPADLDGDGALTIFDFLAFQNAFDMGDPLADFDGDGSLTLFDFLAFQNAFDAGCP